MATGPLVATLMRQRHKQGIAKSPPHYTMPLVARDSYKSSARIISEMPLPPGTMGKTFSD